VDTDQDKAEKPRGREVNLKIIHFICCFSYMSVTENLRSVSHMLAFKQNET